MSNLNNDGNENSDRSDQLRIPRNNTNSRVAISSERNSFTPSNNLFRPQREQIEVVPCTGSRWATTNQDRSELQAPLQFSDIHQHSSGAPQRYSAWGSAGASTELRPQLVGRLPSSCAMANRPSIPSDRSNANDSSESYNAYVSQPSVSSLVDGTEESLSLRLSDQLCFSARGSNSSHTCNIVNSSLDVSHNSNRTQNIEQPNKSWRLDRHSFREGKWISCIKCLSDRFTLPTKSFWMSSSTHFPHRCVCLFVSYLSMLFSIFKLCFWSVHVSYYCNCSDVLIVSYIDSLV